MIKPKIRLRVEVMLNFAWHLSKIISLTLVLTGGGGVNLTPPPCTKSATLATAADRDTPF